MQLLHKEGIFMKKRCLWGAILACVLIFGAAEARAQVDEAVIPTPYEFNYKACNEAYKTLKNFTKSANFDKSGANAPRVLASLGELNAKLNVACQPQRVECAITNSGAVSLKCLPPKPECKKTGRDQYSCWGNTEPKIPGYKCDGLAYTNVITPGDSNTPRPSWICRKDGTVSLPVKPREPECQVDMSTGKPVCKPNPVKPWPRAGLPVEPREGACTIDRATGLKKCPDNSNAQ
jgi:hypothetical protein